MTRRFIIGLIATLTVFSGVVFSTPAYAQSCGEDANPRMTDARRTSLENISSDTGVAREDFSCQDVGDVSDTVVSGRCVTGLCPGAANIRCCVPGTGGRPGGTEMDTGEEETPGGVGIPQRLILPACTETGDCDLDDIIQTGVNFANFLFGISGAVFLAIFVYAGILYLTAGGSTDRVGKAKRMLVQATIGMLLVVGAGIMVTFVHNAFRGGAGDRCEQAHEGFQCTELPEEDLDEEIRNRGCVRGLCPGAENNVCCPAE